MEGYWAVNGDGRGHGGKFVASMRVFECESWFGSDLRLPVRQRSRIIWSTLDKGFVDVVPWCATGWEGFGSAGRRDGFKEVGSP